MRAESIRSQLPADAQEVFDRNFARQKLLAQVRQQPHDLALLEALESAIHDTGDVLETLAERRATEPERVQPQEEDAAAPVM